MAYQSTARLFCDAMATRRHISRRFSNASGEKRINLLEKLSVDDKSIEITFLVGAQMDKRRIVFVDGSIAECDEDTPWHVTQGKG